MPQNHDCIPVYHCFLSWLTYSLVLYSPSLSSCCLMALSRSCARVLTCFYDLFVYVTNHARRAFTKGLFFEFSVHSCTLFVSFCNIDSGLLCCDIVLCAQAEASPVCNECVPGHAQRTSCSESLPRQVIVRRGAASNGDRQALHTCSCELDQLRVSFVSCLTGLINNTEQWLMSFWHRPCLHYSLNLISTFLTYWFL